MLRDFVERRKKAYFERAPGFWAASKKALCSFIKKRDPRLKFTFKSSAKALSPAMFEIDRSRAYEIVTDLEIVFIRSTLKRAFYRRLTEAKVSADLEQE